ncbi:MAG: hypothetical protein J4F36_10070 [Nitrosopumilaceae archaeon]|nr:hypothetical protein [Nitrosopumilaceae archaeon]
MKRKYIFAMCIAVFLLLYFVPFMEGGEKCYPKVPQTGEPDFEGAATYVEIVFSLAGYTIFLFTGGEYETEYGICFQEID